MWCAVYILLVGVSSIAGIANFSLVVISLLAANFAGMELMKLTNCSILSNTKASHRRPHTLRTCLGPYQSVASNYPTVGCQCFSGIKHSYISSCRCRLIQSRPFILSEIRQMGKSSRCCGCKFNGHCLRCGSSLLDNFSGNLPQTVKSRIQCSKYLVMGM